MMIHTDDDTDDDKMMPNLALILMVQHFLVQFKNIGSKEEEGAKGSECHPATTITTRTRDEEPR
jgi:hypothetical protein